MRRTQKDPLPAPLPAPLRESDTRYPSRGSKDRIFARVEVYCVSFAEGGLGWCCPVLPIGMRARFGPAARAYAFRLADGKLCRVGNGPHVKATATLYLRESQRERLAPFLSARERAAEQAHQVRDRIGSRRVQGQAERAAGRRSWNWW